MYFKSGDYVEEFGSENIVCLAAESPNILRGIYSMDLIYMINILFLMLQTWHLIKCML